MSNPSSQERRNPSTWTQALRQLDLKPSRYKGQNFLHDAAVVRRIVDAARVEPGDRVIEIGPGLGILTAELLDRGAIVTAIELDERLASHLEIHLTSPNLRVICADALNVPVEDLYPNESYKVVANLPYSVAAAVVQHFLESGHRPDELVVMVQREVAERIVSRPPDMSILSVAVQFFGEARIVMRVGRGAFIPAPRVDSSVVRITTHQQISLAGNHIGRFSRSSAQGLDSDGNVWPTQLPLGSTQTNRQWRPCLPDRGLIPGDERKR